MMNVINQYWQKYGWTGSIVCMVFAFFGSQALGSGLLGGSTSIETFQSTLTQAEQQVEKIIQAHSTDTSAISRVWPKLEKFQSALYRAMALDPGPGINVPASQVPKKLFAAEINADIIEQYEALKTSDFAKDYRAQFEFDQYLQTAGQIIQHRKARAFPTARAIAKRGTLEKHYAELDRKINSGLALSGIAAGTGSGDAPSEALKTLTQALREQSQSIIKASPEKTGVFGGGSQFIWMTFLAVVCFFLGVTAFRLNPERFQKKLTQAVVGTSQPKQKPLDYVQWLKDFENILSRLKSSQVSIERRIEEIVGHSEKITQSAMSLYSDARIKNEANLEARMGSLIREIQNQLDQSHKLQNGDRIQLPLILEHCLRLCDAVEREAIHLDQKRLNDFINAEPTVTSQPAPSNARMVSGSDSPRA
jgi:hypothetical protein